MSQSCDGDDIPELTDAERILLVAAESDFAARAVLCAPARPRPKTSKAPLPG